MKPTRMSRPAAALAAIAIVAAVGSLGVGAVVVTRGPTPSAMGPPVFHDEAATSGIDHVYDGPFAFATGGGVAAFDCDDDGRPELYIAGGARPAALYRNESPVGGALAFRLQPSPETDLTNVTGAYPLDIDGDGVTDLVVLREGENVLLRGLGDCRFERANAAWSFDGGSALTTAFSATWEVSAALPTLAFGNYLKLDATGETTFDCDDNAIYRPDPSRHRARAGRHRDAAVRRRHDVAVDRLASGVRRRQRRRPRRPVRLKGKRRGPGGLRHSRSEQPVPRPARRDVRRERGPGR